MRKLSLTSGIALLALATATAAVATPADAAKYDKYIKVTPLLNQVGTCRTGVDQVNWAYTLKARLARRNVERPATIRMRYEVTDLDTEMVVRKQTVKLKPRRYFAVGRPTQYVAGHQLQFQLDVTFKSPINGKRLRKRSISNLTVPTVAQMDAANAAKPERPPFPGCGTIVQ